MMLSFYSIRLLAAVLLVAGCRSEKVVFQFRPPASIPHAQPPVPPDTLAATGVATALPKAYPQRAKPLAQVARPRWLRPPLTQPRRLVARVSRPLTRYLKSPLREQAAVQALSKPVRIGLVLMGMALLLLLLVLLTAPSVVTFEGAVLAYVGYLLAVGTFIAGAVVVALGLLLAKP